MMPPIEHILAGSALLLVISIVASKAAARYGIPALLLFLGIGMLAGADGPGGIYFDNAWQTQAIGVVALAFILFSGGLDTDWQYVRPALRNGLSLATIGVALTAVSVALFSVVFLNFSPQEGLLLGAIISSTDAAAVFSLLRARGAQLKGQLSPLLELESGSNDPMAVFLTMGMIRLLSEPGLSAVNLIPMFVQQMALGALFGYGMGKVATSVINHIRLTFDGLYPVFTIALVMLTYGLTASLGGNGFLAVYITGLVLGNSRFVHKRSLLHFHDGLAWLMQIAMFLTLGLQVFPSQLVSVVPAGLLLSAVLIFIGRPLSVFISLSLSKLTWRDKLLLSWVGLRGAAPIILATFPLLAEVSKANAIFNLVFFTVLTSVLLQGTLLFPIARLLRVDETGTVKYKSPLDYVLKNGQISDDLTEFTIEPDSYWRDKQILELDLPEGTLIVLVGREGELIVPTGGTILREGDIMLILANRSVRDNVSSLLHRRMPTHQGAPSG
jgi:potassium/hydrogen antiporter